MSSYYCTYIFSLGGILAVGSVIHFDQPGLMRDGDKKSFEYVTRVSV